MWGTGRQTNRRPGAGLLCPVCEQGGGISPPSRFASAPVPPAAPGPWPTFPLAVGRGSILCGSVSLRLDMHLNEVSLDPTFPRSQRVARDPFSLHGELPVEETQVWQTRRKNGLTTLAPNSLAGIVAEPAGGISSLSFNLEKELINYTCQFIPTIFSLVYLVFKLKQTNKKTPLL